jgi:uncharacterized protein DUF4333
MPALVALNDRSRPAGRTITVRLRMVRPLLVVVLPATALAAVGCAKKIDTSKAERSIKAGLESKQSGSISTVTCPDSVDIKKGSTFTCNVVGTNGKTAKITVLQTDNKGDVTYSGNLAAIIRR